MEGALAHGEGACAATLPRVQEAVVATSTLLSASLPGTTHCY